MRIFLTVFSGGHVAELCRRSAKIQALGDFSNLKGEKSQCVGPLNPTSMSLGLTDVSYSMYSRRYYLGASGFSVVCRLLSPLAVIFLLN